MVERCALYARLSYAPDGSVEAVTRQEEFARGLAARLGWGVGAVFVDNSLSAWKRGVIRPGWDRMLAGLRSGACDGLVSYHGDRLIRSDRGLIDLFDIAEERGLPMASVSGTRDLSSPDDRYILRIEVAGYIRESDSISRRVKAALERNARLGKARPGRYRAYGYDRAGMEIIPGEAAVVREMAARMLAGAALNSVPRWLNAESVPTVTGAPWIRATVRSVLTSPRIAGLRALRGDIIGPGQWPGILDRETWEDVQQVVKSWHYGKGRGSRVPRAHLLTGIAACGSCGRGLRSLRRSGHPGRHIYWCDNPACPGPKVARSEEHLDEYVTAATITVLNSPEARASRQQRQGSPVLAAEITALETRMSAEQAAMDEMRDSGDPDFDPVLAMRRIGSWKRRIASLRGQMEATSRQRLIDATGELTRGQWDGLTLERRHAIISALWTVTVLPAARKGRQPFDPECVRLVLRED